MITEFKQLNAGDVRKRDDQVRRTWKTNGSAYHYPTLEQGWQPIRLIGESILQSDLIVSEFRRPLI